MVIFNATILQEAGEYLLSMFGAAPLYDSQGLYGLITFLPILLLAAFCSTPFAGRWSEKLRQGPLPAKIVWAGGMAALFVVCTAMLVDNSYNPFLYFQF